ITGSIDLNPVDPTRVVLRARAFGATGLPGPYFLAELALPRATVNAALPPLEYEDFVDDVQARIDKGVRALDKAIEATLQGQANAAAIIDEQNTRQEGDRLIAERVTGVVAQQGVDRAATAAIESASIGRDDALSSRIEVATARIGTNEATISQETSARIAGDNATAGQITDVLARTNAGTAAGRFSLQVTSAPGEVTARLQALLATQYGGQTYGAGYYLDLLNDGSSRYVVDANAFYITANGSSVPLLSFDGYTLRVPNLILTSPNVPQGVASVPARFDASNYTLISGQGGVNNVLDPNMIANISVENGSYPTIVSLYGTLSMGPGTNVGPIDLLIDGNQVAPVLFGGFAVQATTINNPNAPAKFYGFAVVYLGAGNHQARFRYTYSGNQAGSQVVINDIHLAAVTPRA
ncbi:hypothetical protein SAMN05192565_1671, partial [Methylobacterium gossipiicola]